MIRNGRKSRAVRDFSIGADSYYSLFASLFISRLKFDGKQELDKFGAGVEDRYLAKLLFEYGRFAYDKITGLFLPFFGEGELNAYGEHNYFRLTGLNGKPLALRARDEVALFHANGTATPLAPYIALQCALLADFDNAIKQNLDGIKGLSVIVTNNPSQQNQLIKANDARLAGESMAILTRSSAEFELTELQQLQTGAQYLCDKLTGDQRKRFEHLLHVVGVRTPPEKGERLITNEVNAQNDEADSFIEMLLNTVNDEAKEQNINLKVVLKAYYEGVNLDGDKISKIQGQPAGAGNNAGISGENNPDEGDGDTIGA